MKGGNKATNQLSQKLPHCLLKWKSFQNTPEHYYCSRRISRLSGLLEKDVLV